MAVWAFTNVTYMNIYKAPNVVIRSDRKVYRKGAGGATYIKLVRRPPISDFCLLFVLFFAISENKRSVFFYSSKANGALPDPSSGRLFLQQ